jgi:hypothetical protein
MDGYLNSVQKEVRDLMDITCDVHEGKYDQSFCGSHVFNTRFELRRAPFSDEVCSNVVAFSVPIRGTDNILGTTTMKARLMHDGEVDTHEHGVRMMCWFEAGLFSESECQVEFASVFRSKNTILDDVAKPVTIENASRLVNLDVDTTCRFTPHWTNEQLQLPPRHDAHFGSSSFLADFAREDREFAIAVWCTKYWRPSGLSLPDEVVRCIAQWLLPDYSMEGSMALSVGILK